jgi:large subunit ribosomal protein L5
MNSLKEKYTKEIIPALTEKYNYTTVMAVPKLEKIVVNMGVGDATLNSKLLDVAVSELEKITGATPVITKAKKSIAGFKIREGQAIGCKVTLRGEAMYTFLEKLIKIVLPRVRDFQGISPKSFDKNGNYSLGLEEQLMFPEIEYDKIDQIRGMDICIVTTAKNQEEGLALLKEFGFPFQS